MIPNDIFIDRTNLPQPLTKEETRNLVIQMKNGSLKAREKLILHNIRLVLNEAINRFSSYNVERKELVSIGLVGLIRAVDNYDLSKKCELSSFATKCIDNEILLFFKRTKKYMNDESMEKVIVDDNEGSQIKVVESISSDEDIIGDYEHQEIIRILKSIVENLPYNEQLIINHYYGIDDNELMSQKDLARIFGVDASIICKRQKAIIKKIRGMMITKGLIEGKQSDEVTRKRDKKG